MRAERAIERLVEHQTHLIALLERSRQALSGSVNVETARLAQMRWELMRVLRDYQLFKHTEIFDPVIRTGGPSQADMARRMKQRCNKVADDYADHVRRWTLLGAVDRWPEYRTDALALVDRLFAAIAEERRGVTTLLAGMERTRQRCS